MAKFLSSKWTKAALFVLCLIPFVRVLLPVLAALMDLRDSIAMKLPQNSFCARPRPQSNRVHHPLHRRLDAALLLITLTVTPLRSLSEPSATDALPPHAGAVRILLRDGASGDLGLARQGSSIFPKCGRTF